LKNDAATTAIERLNAVLASLGPVAVAASGGVDSMTLAILAHRRAPDACQVFHAASPAVPPEATARVRRHAAREGWALTVIDAGEFADPEYRRNPANRCFHCKTNLYDTIARHTDRPVLSGANLDDLGDWRPGLEAARDHGVRHPYIEAAVGKAAVRAIADHLGLGDLAALPSSPCLSSRVETGIRIEADMLALVHAAEKFVTRRLRPRTVRCRVRADGVVIEVDSTTLDRLDKDDKAALGEAVAAMFAREGQARDVRFAPYRMGSAFLRPS